MEGTMAVDKDEVNLYILSLHSVRLVQCSIRYEWRFDKNSKRGLAAPFIM